VWGARRADAVDLGVGDLAAVSHELQHGAQLVVGVAGEPAGEGLADRAVVAADFGEALRCVTGAFLAIQGVGMCLLLEDCTGLAWRGRRR